MDQTISVWITTGLAIATAVGSFISWWRSTVSGQVKAEAEAARNEARQAQAQAESLLEKVERQAAAAEQTAMTISALADNLTPRQITLTWASNTRFLIHNNTRGDLTITSRETDGSEALLRGADIGAKIPAGQAIEGLSVQTLAGGSEELRLGFDGLPGPVTLSFAERPSR